LLTVKWKDVWPDLWALVDNDLALVSDDLVYYQVDKLLDENEVNDARRAISLIKRVAETGKPDLNALTEAYVLLSSLYFRKPQPPEMKIRLEEAKRRLANILTKLGTDVKQLDDKAKERLSEKVKAAQQAAQQQAQQATAQQKPAQQPTQPGNPGSPQQKQNEPQSGGAKQ
jgi:Mg2+ and Co2+ transporter CorA